jgi:hypothetical protein
MAETTTTTTVPAIANGDIFRLVGRTNEFVATRTYLAAGFIPAVVGITTDGRFQTAARIADVVVLRRASS